MESKPSPTLEMAERRRRAEQRLRERLPEFGVLRTEADMQRLLNELQQQQIELEMQNEELQQARNQTAAGLEKFSDLYDSAPVGYLTLDRQGTIREANLTMAGLLGVDRPRLLLKTLGPWVAPADMPVFATFLGKVFDLRSRQFCEISLVREGRTPLEVRIEAVVSSSGWECRAAIVDITDRKRAEEDRLVLSKLESTGILAGGIAHDFNNLLAVILVDLDLARGLATPGTQLAQHLDNAKHSALTARGLSQQLITFAKGGTPVRKPARLHEIVRESTQLALAGSRVRCDFITPEDLWLVEVDAGQIGQVFRNIALNAREAMPLGGVIIVRAGNVSLGRGELAALAAGDYVRVSIADQGGGIAREVLPKIFDPYFSTKQRGDQKGMGLGLTICHTVVQKHGGTITVDSESAAGTTFHVYLPACRKLPGETTTSEAAVPPRLGRILVMDDEEGMRRVVAASLRGMGHEVELVEDGRKAIEAYRRATALGRPFDAVLLDLTVRAGVGGHEAVQALIEMDPAVKAVVMSGYANDPVVLEPERHGFKGVLAKPFDSDSLRKAIGRVLEA